MIDGIHQGDVREWLAGLPDESVHCAITSPPYWGLRDYQLDPGIWGGDADCEHEWTNKPVLVAHQTDYSTSGLKNDGRPEAARLATNAAGTSAREGESTMAETAFCSLCSAWRGDLGLEPTPELYIEHMVSVFRDLRRVLRKDGTFWLNIGDSMADKNLQMMPARLALALQADGWILRSQIVWAKGISFCDSYSGSVMPESCRDRPTSAYEMVYLLTKNERYFYDADAVRENFADARMGNPGSPSPKAGRIPGQSPHSMSKEAWESTAAGRNLRNVWTITPGQMSWEMCSACKRVYSGAEFVGDLKRLDVCLACEREYVPKQMKYLPESEDHRRTCQCGRNDAWKRITWCKCGREDSWLSHFATFPERLVKPMLLAGCPHKVCTECGSPWVREVERGSPSTWEHRKESGDLDQPGVLRNDKKESLPGALRIDASRSGFGTGDFRTLGFRPTCACTARPSSDPKNFDHMRDENKPTEPGLVIDPFMGSGTVALAAHKFGRRWAGCELNSDYVILAEERIRRATEQGRLGIDG